MRDSTTHIAQPSASNAMRVAQLVYGVMASYCSGAAS